jgi:hypothetical protein
MKPKYFSWLLIPFLSFSLISFATAGTYPISIQYQSIREFPSLQQRLGSTLGIAPFQDLRPDTLYIGHHTSFWGSSNYFRSDPFPLETAIKESLSPVLSRYGVRTVPISNWDGEPASLKNMEVDSILTVEIKRFWAEGKASLLGNDVRTSIHLIFHLGVKKEGKVFTRNVEVEKEMTVGRLTPERLEKMVNQILTDIFDNFFSNPYEMS